MMDAQTDGLFLALALPFLASLSAPPLVRYAGRASVFVLAAFPFAAFCLIASQAGDVTAGSVVLWGADWVPSLGIRLSFRLDGLSFVFALLITGIGTLIVLYSGCYLAGRRDLGRFHAFILMFMGAMLALVLADDLMTLIVAWELTSITSFLLIGFDHEREAARRAALQALLVTGGGGLALLAGLILVRDGMGLTSLTDVLGAGDALRSSPLYLPVLLLVLCGAFTKSAQMPFHVWLPNAMEAPTPVSAYLHSATMVKAGIYLLLRFNPAIGGTPAWETILPVFGSVTLVLGALLALGQSDLKRVLAYTTLASLGLLVLLIGIGTPAAIEAAVLYLIAHCLFKGGLFMVAGAIDHGAGTRDIALLGGLRGAMPATFAAGLLCALSMGGMTPFFGFLAKESLYGAMTDGGASSLLWLVATVAGNALMFASAFLVGLKPFVGARPAAQGHPHEASPLILAGPLVLGFFGLATGLLSGATHAFLSGPMASAAIGRPAAIEISALPHLNLAFALSLATILCGIGLYRRAEAARAALCRIFDALGWGPDKGFDQALRGLLRGAFTVTAIFQSGRLDRYMTTAFVVIAAVLFGSMAAACGWPALPSLPDAGFAEWLVCLLLLAGLLAVVAAKDRLTAIVSLGIQGFAVALLFVLTGAPDLSFTQFMVETLSVVILALVMTRLKLSPGDRRPWRETLPDATIAIACGAGLGLLLLAVTQRPFDRTLPDVYERTAATIAHGRNVVNVILVDFRGFDTMGEIAVVMTTGLAILALIRIRVRPANPARRPDPQEATP